MSDFDVIGWSHTNNVAASAVSGVLTYKWEPAIGGADLVMTLKDGLILRQFFPYGKSVEFTWEGTRLGIKIEGDADYTFVDLKGEKGDYFTPEIGTVETLSAGSKAIASIDIDPETMKATLNLGIPKGRDGSGGGGNIDTEMSDTSENAVMNKVIKAYIDAQSGGGSIIKPFFVKYMEDETFYIGTTKYTGITASFAGFEYSYTESNKFILAIMASTSSGALWKYVEGGTLFFRRIKDSYDSNWIAK